MSPEAVIGKVLGLDPGAITNETSSTSVEVWDSLAHITLMLELQSTYDITFSVEEALAIKDCATIKRVLTDKGVRW